MMFVHHFLSEEKAFVCKFLTEAIADNLFDNPVVF